VPSSRSTTRPGYPITATAGLPTATLPTASSRAAVPRNNSRRLVHVIRRAVPPAVVPPRAGAPDRQRCPSAPLPTGATVAAVVARSSSGWRTTRAATRAAAAAAPTARTNRVTIPIPKWKMKRCARIHRASLFPSGATAPKSLSASPTTRRARRRRMSAAPTRVPRTNRSRRARSRRQLTIGWIPHDPRMGNRNPARRDAVPC